MLAILGLVVRRLHEIMHDFAPFPFRFRDLDLRLPHTLELLLSGKLFIHAFDKLAEILIMLVQKLDYFGLRDVVQQLLEIHVCDQVKTRNLLGLGVLSFKEKLVVVKLFTETIEYFLSDIVGLHFPMEVQVPLSSLIKFLELFELVVRADGTVNVREHRVYLDLPDPDLLRLCHKVQLGDDTILEPFKSPVLRHSQPVVDVRALLKIRYHVLSGDVVVLRDHARILPEAVFDGQAFCVVLLFDVELEEPSHDVYEEFLREDQLSHELLIRLEQPLRSYFSKRAWLVAQFFSCEERHSSIH
mmetsp:Transcript_32575/g.37160  ORF Transcript_32575/g.37160 Transcript_32575/m.37160 type:complete len:300 (+) Transcript_32575:148-1047(+)